jgi:hypothetical protein
MRLRQIAYLVSLGAALVTGCGSSSSSSSPGTTPGDGGTPPAPPVTPGDGGADGGCAKAPPSGVITLAVAASAGSSHMGQMTSLVLDGEGDPMIAFSSASEAGKLFFTKWDRCAGAFTAAAVVDDLASPGTGEVNDNVPLRQVSLARDPSSGALQLAYVTAIPTSNTASQTVWAAKSPDGGATWTKEQVSVHPGDEAGDVHYAENPRAAFGEGKAWIAYGQNFAYCDGSLSSGGPRCDGFLASGDLGAWQRQVIPRGSNGPTSRSALSLAADSAGKVALAYVTNPDTGSNRVVEYWRPGSNPVDVFDSAGEQNDDPSVSLAFFGTKPRIVAYLQQPAAADYDMLFSQSGDGVTWAPAVHVARDATRVTAWFPSLAIDSTGRMAIAADDNGGTDATPKCGSPKIARSSDGLTWDTCGADPMPEPGTSGDYVSAAYGPDGKLQIAFENDSQGGTYGQGVLYWHE